MKMVKKSRKKERGGGGERRPNASISNIQSKK